MPVCRPGNTAVAACGAPPARTPNSVEEASVAWTYASWLNGCQVAKAELRRCEGGLHPWTSSSSPLSVLNLPEASLRLVLSGSGESDNQTL